MSNLEKYPNVAIIVLNWNDSINTIACVKSLQALQYPHYRIYIIDNNSEDNSIQEIKKIFPEIDLYNSGSNLGWAGGNNFGIKLAFSHGYNHFYLVNPDIRVQPETLSALVEAIESDKVGAVGSVVVSHSNPDWIEFAGAALDKNLGFSRQISMKKSEFIFDGSNVIVPELKGCSLLITENGFKGSSFFDERYFLNYDETDWCFRTRSKNMICILAKKSICFHIGAATFGGTGSPLYRYFIARNRVLFSKNNLDKNSFIFAWRCIGWELKSAVFGLSGEKTSIKKKALVIISLLYALRDAALGRYGDCPTRVRKINKIFKIVK